MTRSNSNRYYLMAAAVGLLSLVAMWNHNSAAIDEQEEDEEHEEFVHLNEEQRALAGINVEAIQPGFLQNTLRANGKIVLNKNHVAHVIPKISGIVAQVQKNDGEDVLEGETLLLLESREIAEAKSEYLGALEKQESAGQLFLMEQQLNEKQMTSTHDFQNALKEINGVERELELARQKLLVLGIEENEIALLENSPASTLRFYEVKSPLTGTILKRHATQGELLSSEKEAFIVANLDHLWVEIDVYPQDQPLIKKGTKIRLENLNGQKGVAKIISINPLIDEETRKVKAIAVLDNQQKKWSPGSYVKVEIDTTKLAAPIVTSKDAVQNIEGSNCVFVEAENGFEIRPVEIGRCDGKRIEILSGVKHGEKVASSNTFLLKADHLKNEAEHEH